MSKHSISNTELPSELDAVAKLLPSFAPTIQGLKSKLAGVTIIGSLTITDTINPNEHATIQLDLTP